MNVSTLSVETPPKSAIVSNTTKAIPAIIVGHSDGIMIFNDPISNGRSVVEMVVGNLISLARRFYETNVSCRTGLWEKTQKC